MRSVREITQLVASVLGIIFVAGSLAAFVMSIFRLGSIDTWITATVGALSFAFGYMLLRGSVGQPSGLRQLETRIAQHDSDPVTA